MSMRMRRGSAGGTPPGPPPATFGPVEGPQWVRDNAAPQAITVPPGAIEFTSRADLVTKIAANPAGTDFKSVANTVYPWTSPLQESVKAPRIYLLPGTIIDGQNNSVSGITGFSSEPGAAGIHIRGGILRNFWRAFSMNGNCILEDTTVHNCFEKCFNFGGSNNRATRVYVHTGGRYNVTMFNSSGYGVDNVLEHCHIENGNWRNLDPTIDAGGTKFLIQDGLICRYNWVEGNNGSGLWWDGDNRNLEIYDNVCENNDRWGIFYELGFGGTVINNNALFDNANDTQASSGFGTAQLLSSGSDATAQGDTTFIDIHHNWIDGNGTQVQMGVMNHLNHGLAKGTHFRDNDVWDRGTTLRRMAGVVSTNGTIPLTDDNTFENNHYHVLSSQLSVAKFMFGDNQNDPADGQTFTQWKAAGRDDTGTMVSI